jgi:hypothetical protein
MFICSHTNVVFDHLRVPYTIASGASGSAHPLAGCATLLGRNAPRRSMYWPVFDAGSPVRLLAVAPRRFHCGRLILHGHVVPDDVVTAWLAGTDTEWHPVETVTDGQRDIASIWRSDRGDVFLPFDPNEIVRTFWSEGYHDDAGAGPAVGLRSAAVSAYYLIRPVMPRRLQIAVRRLYSRVQARTPFPRWPVEGSLHGFLDRMLEWAADLAGEAVPRIAPWPHGYSWAFVLTHDVETADGLRRLPVLREVELAAGFRSSWNLVPARYRVPDDVVAQLHAAGFEVGVHGLYHDGRDLADGVLAERLPEMLRWAGRWNAVGFRSPATHRAWATMAALPFEYDSSYPDTDPFEPQPGGCCSWLPYVNGTIVELPITLPQDHTVFVILRHADGRIWIDKTELIRAAGGMALLITHPDYADAAITRAYAELLAHVADDASAWRALPVEVSRWWRRRERSRLEPADDGWQVVGPARDEAHILYTAPAPQP